jgi:hypothetical protein
MQKENPGNGYEILRSTVRKTRRNGIRDEVGIQNFFKAVGVNQL